MVYTTGVDCIRGRYNMTVGFIGGKFYPLHLGHVYAITQASNMVDELYVVLSHSKKREMELSRQDDFRYIDAETRLSWLGKMSNDMSNVMIVEVEDEDSLDEYNTLDEYDWEYGATQIKKKIGKTIDYVFSSEEEYTPIFNKLYPTAEHIMIDNDRDEFNFCATDIRRNLYDNWHNLPRFVQKDLTKKVAIVGTESCGKSTLTRNLARIFNTTYVDEYGRDICIEYSNFLTEEHFKEIAYVHKVNEIRENKNANKVLFIDSEAVVTKYYLKLYGKEDSSLYDEIALNQDYDLYIYLEPDIKWVDDGLRDQGEEEVRKTNNKLLKSMFDELGINYISINGNYQERFKKAYELIKELMNEG